MRIALSLLSFAVSAFCFIEAIMGILISSFARGQIRGVPRSAFAKEAAILMAVSVVCLWVGHKIWPRAQG